MLSQKKRVLIVDDEEDLTWTLSKKLSRDSDQFELICVNSGREAIEVLNQLPIHLVITDVRMPEVSGLDLLVQIKKHYPSTKVVIMTGYGSSEMRREATERGCFHYIEKPFDLNEMRELILDAIRDRQGFRGNVSDFQLSDIIQLNCLGGLTSALQVKTEAEEGWIYFLEGNVVHAETEVLEGENAFYYIMSWQGGEFSVYRNRKPPRQTIAQGWQSLLLESLRRVDEQSHLVKQEVEQKKQFRVLKLQQIFEPILSDNVEHLLIHSFSGFTIFYQGRFRENADQISELGHQLSHLLEQMTADKLSFADDFLKIAEIHYRNRVLFVARISREDTYLTIVGRKGVNLRAIRQHLKENLSEILALL